MTSGDWLVVGGVVIVVGLVWFLWPSDEVYAPPGVSIYEAQGLAYQKDYIQGRVREPSSFKRKVPPPSSVGGRS